MLAEFVVTEPQKTVFVGIYRVNAVDVCPPGSTDELLSLDITGHFRYDLTLTGHLVTYIDRVVIDLGRWDEELGSARNEPSQAGDRDRRAV